MGGGDQSQPGTGTGPDDTAPGVNPLGLSNSDQGALNLSDADFSGLSDMDLGFATGGGVGLGSLRGNFQEGGAPASAPADDPAWDQAFAAEVKAAPANPAAAPATGRGGAAPVGDLIKQNFGDRAGYASTISSLESGQGKSYVGDDGSSYGPFQLHYGGVSQKYPHPGLGDEFTKQTGLDARDPNTQPQQVKFVSDWTAKHGWGAWSTKAQADQIAGGANVPSAGAQPAEADTSSYGGGFQLPGQDSPQQPQRMPTQSDELKRDPWSYLRTVGAAMMASRAPQLGTALGEGFEAGNKYLGQMQSLEKDWNVSQAQINNMSAEAREHGADADLKVQQLQVSKMMNQIFIQRMRARGMIPGGDGTGASGATGGQGTGIAPIKPLGPVGTPSAAGAAPSGGAGASGAGGIGTSRDGAAPAAPAAGAAPSGGRRLAALLRRLPHLAGYRASLMTQTTRQARP